MEGIWRDLTETMWRTMTGRNSVARTSRAIVFLLLFCFCIIISLLLSDNLILMNKKGTGSPMRLNCVNGNLTRTCPKNYYPSKFYDDDGMSSRTSTTCPDYFRWIYEDLKPWRDTGITKDMVERAGRTANFRLVILNGRAYVQIYEKAFQTRDTFTLWGILQLLRRYPGKIPDLDLMFDCVDWPVVKSNDYNGPEAVAPPPLFRYCGDDETMDIVFPDWSFWGWPETNIKPWELLSREIKIGNERTQWEERDRHAYWKGNPVVAEKRMELLKCNVSENRNWKALIYSQNWTVELKQGFKQSDLANQCNHKYKIYIEGSAWSVSEKYILACDSVTFLVKPHYYDFFTRGLFPLLHYWPIRDEDKCRSIKFGVEWGNSHPQRAQEIGKAGSDFTQNDLKMDYVYDYMFHLFNEYAKLLRYKPEVPEGAVELCSETMVCPAQGLTEKFMIKSLVKDPGYGSPCTMRDPFDRIELESILRRKADSISRVERWEVSYWEKQNKEALIQ